MAVGQKQPLLRVSDLRGVAYEKFWRLAWSFYEREEKGS